MIAEIIFGAVIIAGFLVGLRLLQSPRTALWGNRLGACSMVVGIIYALIAFEVAADPVFWLFILFGLALGLLLGGKVKMIQMPQAVALLNGSGGAASAFVAVGTVLLSVETGNWWFFLPAALALAIGTLTFFGSIVAAGKLQNWVAQQPVQLPGHRSILMLLLILGVVLVAFSSTGQGALFGQLWPFTLLVFALYGIFMALRVGGADMPVLISLLNSFSGMAAAVTGLAVQHLILVGAGALVGVAGLILTGIMCRAMNRNLKNVLGGFKAAHVTAGATGTATAGLSEELVNHSGKSMAEEELLEKPAAEEKVETVFPGLTEKLNREQRPGEETSALALSPTETAAEILGKAEKVIIVPGYGMAVAQAQQQVKELVDYLESQGTETIMAIHPVAGRMPGHMNVLLAEVGIDYDKLWEMEQANQQFPEADAVLVVGACDVVNPAANSAEGTPIYGMPILEVDQASRVIICNLDDQPGYSGVPNTLYQQEHVVPVWGDAKDNIKNLYTCLKEPQAKERYRQQQHGVETSALALSPTETAAEILGKAEKVIIVPGYGMAVAQAQPQVKDLVDYLEAQGTETIMAIHPVAGRMPGHMNVLLAEVGIDYDKLWEMEQANQQFPEADAVLVVGACDVVNPAANSAEGTPIYGMPILEVDQASRVIVCNLDDQPGYSGVPNTLYQQEHVVAIWGDAKDNIENLYILLKSAR